MNFSRLQMASAIIASIILIGFVFFVPHTREVASEHVAEKSETLPPTTTSNLPVHDLFKKGTHTITGSLEAPNACAIVQAQATLASSTDQTQVIRVAISIQKDEGVCLQEPTMMDFSATVVAPAHTPITTSVNGAEVPTTVL